LALSVGLRYAHFTEEEEEEKKKKKKNGNNMDKRTPAFPSLERLKTAINNNNNKKQQQQQEC